MFTVYSKPNCPFCVQAKALLAQNNKEYVEIHLDFNQPKLDGQTYISREAFFEQFPTQKTMPLILGPEGAIGGFTELKEYLEYDF